MEYVIYTDESEKAGQYFGNFYGGALVRSVDLHNVLDQIALKKASLHLNDEVKWTKITANYLAKYIELMDCFFDLIAEDKVKVRIMFTKNSNVATNLSTQQRRETYHRLYYQFLKHAFGLRFAAGPTGERIGLRINLDQLPANKEQNTQFKAFLLGLNRNSDFKRAGVFLREDKIAEVESRRSNRGGRIAEVESHHHGLLQCLDVVLGAMAFRLNDKHLEKPAGQSRRGKKTIAKETVYKHINSRIRLIYPNFNVGISTGKHGMESLWEDSYRHWLFLPKERQVDPTRHKP